MSAAEIGHAGESRRKTMQGKHEEWVKEARGKPRWNYIIITTR